MRNNGKKILFGINKTWRDCKIAGFIGPAFIFFQNLACNNISF